MTNTPQSDAQTAVPSGRFADQIARGAAWLDEECADWRDRINVGELRMSDPCDCVIGQVFGNYYEDLDMTLLESDRHGFSVSGFDHEDWNVLGVEWQQYIEATR